MNAKAATERHRTRGLPVPAASMPLQENHDDADRMTMPRRTNQYQQVSGCRRPHFSCFGTATHHISEQRPDSALPTRPQNPQDRRHWTHSRNRYRNPPTLRASVALEATTTHRCRTLLKWSAGISVELEYCFGIRLSCRRVSKRSDARMLPWACCSLTGVPTCWPTRCRGGRQCG